MSLNKKVGTLCLLHNKTHISLGMKKRGFGEGRYNGYGGKVNPNETIKEAAYRELEEETGVSNAKLEKKAKFDFHFDDGLHFEVHVFVDSNYEGNPQETEEMRPRWFEHSEIPYDSMWPDDRFWMPQILRGEKLKGTFYFHDQNSLYKYEINRVNELN